MKQCWFDGGPPSDVGPTNCFNVSCSLDVYWIRIHILPVIYIHWNRYKTHEETARPMYIRCWLSRHVDKTHRVAWLSDPIMCQIHHIKPWQIHVLYFVICSQITDLERMPKKATMSPKAITQQNTLAGSLQRAHLVLGVWLVKVQIETNH